MRAEMTCGQCRELLPRYQARQLPDTEGDSVARHIAGCEVCRRELALWSAISEALVTTDATQPITAVNQARVWDNVQAALARERPMPALQLDGRGRHISMLTPTPTPRTSRRSSMPPAPSPCPSPRRRPVVAFAAFALVVVLSIALFGVVAPRLRHNAQTGHGPQPTATPAACAPSQLRQSLPANATINAISMASARDGWAVGQIWDPRHATTPPRMLMLHFQDCQWRQAGPSISPVELTAVAMASPDDGWAVGATMMPDDPTNAHSLWHNDHGVLLHYHDGAWQQVAFPDSQADGYEQISMVSSTDGWMLVYEGKAHITPYTTAEHYGLYHYDGTAWSAVSTPFKTPNMSFGGMAAGPGDLWLTGYDIADFTSGTIARYHDGQWQTWKSTSNELYVVALSSPQNVWAYGSRTAHDASGVHFSEVVLHYDGTIWSQVPSAKAFPTMPSSTTATTLANGDVWSFEQELGAPDPTTIAIHCAATGCEARPLVVPGVESVAGLSMFSATQGFAIGDHMVYMVFFSQVTGTQESIGVLQSTLLFYDGGQWSIIPSAG